jgi:hypothetical protein
LLIAVLTLSFSLKFSMLVGYFFNQGYYINVLCENKDKPKSGCNGKCHLSKELATTETKSDKQIPEEILKYEISVFLINGTCRLDSEMSSCQFFYPVFRDNNMPAGFSADIFHPPTA